MANHLKEGLVADALSAAWIDREQKEHAWRAARQASDLARSAGAESLAVVTRVAARLAAGGDRELSASEAAAAGDLKIATEVVQQALKVEATALDAFGATVRAYKELELAWASQALSSFQARWSCTHKATEVSHG